jgi:hypothetical protein
MRLLRNREGKFVSQWAYNQEANAGKLAFGIMLLFGVILSLIDSVI